MCSQEGSADVIGLMDRTAKAYVAGRQGKDIHAVVLLSGS